MDSKVSYGLRDHADSGVAWIAKCRTVSGSCRLRCRMDSKVSYGPAGSCRLRCRMDSKVSYGRRGHADSGVAWIAKCRTPGFLWAGKRCDSRVAVRQRGVRQLAIHATAESPWRAVAGFPRSRRASTGLSRGHTVLVDVRLMASNAGHRPLRSACYDRPYSGPQPVPAMGSCEPGSAARSAAVTGRLRRSCS